MGVARKLLTADALYSRYFSLRFSTAFERGFAASAALKVGDFTTEILNLNLLTDAALLELEERR
jgi:hypothetical protein